VTVADALVIRRGELAEGPAVHDEPRSLRRPRVSHDLHLAAEVAVPELDRLTDRHDPPRCALGCQPDPVRPWAGVSEPVPSGDGQADVGLDLIRDAGADSAHGGQRLRGQCEPGGMPPAGGAARGDRRRAA
jgi:hypothetical protein